MGWRNPYWSGGDCGLTENDRLALDSLEELIPIPSFGNGDTALALFDWLYQAKLGGLINQAEFYKYTYALRCKPAWSR